MDLELKYKLYLIDKSLTFPEWIVCKELLGNLGDIKYDEDEYIDGKFIYHYNSKKDIFYLSYFNIWSVFDEKYNMNYADIQELTLLYIENTYNLKGINIYYISHR
jgi:hypothetical protein